MDFGEQPTRPIPSTILSEGAGRRSPVYFREWLRRSLNPRRVELMAALLVDRLGNLAVLVFHERHLRIDDLPEKLRFGLGKNFVLGLASDLGE